jgi:hypothetical protein
MKKVFVFLVSGILLSVLLGCADKENLINIYSGANFVDCH